MEKIIFRDKSQVPSVFFSFCKKARSTFGVHFEKNGRPKGRLAQKKAAYFSEF